MTATMKLDTVSKLTLIGVYAMQNTIAATMANDDVDQKKTSPDTLADIFGAAAAKDLPAFAGRNQIAWMLANIARDSANPVEVSRHLLKTAAHGVNLVGVDIRQTFDDFVSDMISALKNPSPLKNAQTADHFGVSPAEFAVIKSSLETAGFAFTGNTITALPTVQPQGQRYKQALRA
jgi:hypothetical protein